MAFQKSRSFVSPHDVSSSEWYAMTINPSPKEIAHCYEAKDAFRSFLAYMKKILNDLHTDINYDGYIELSDKGRFHFHMKIQFLGKESILYFYYFLYKNQHLMQYKFGTYMDEELNNSSEHSVFSWDDYIKKQCKFWKALDKDSRLRRIQPTAKDITTVM